MTFGYPTKSHPEDGFSISGTKGWVDVKKEGSNIKVVLYSLVKEDDNGEYEEKEEKFEDPFTGVEHELKSFFAIINGKDDGLGLGNPKNALKDVAFIQAALNSHGSLVDLEELATLGV